MSKEGKYLVSIETVKIKDFIFSTNTLKVIRGASYLLDYVNQKLVREVIIKNEVKEEDIVYINAGNAKFFVETEKKAEEIIKLIKKTYKDYAPGAKLVTGFVEYKKDTKIWDLFDDMAKETAVAKSRGFTTLNIDIPFIQKCNICGKNHGEYKKEDIKSKDILNGVEDNIKLNINKKELEEQIFKNIIKEKDRVVCRECLHKIVFSNLIKDKEENKEIFMPFYAKFQNKIGDFKIANDLSAYKDGKSFIGFMYADGDALGDFLKNVKGNYINKNDFKNKDGNKITKEEAYLSFYEEFSKKLDEITIGSLIEVIEEMKDRFPNAKDKNDKEIDGKNYGEFLIVGGDDVCAIFPPYLVMEISQRYQQKFQDEMDKYWKETFKNEEKINNITTSSGVIIAKHKTPLHYLFDQSLLLQKEAKKNRYLHFREKEKEYKKGFIDFQVIGGEGTVDIKKFRKGIEGTRKEAYIVDRNEILNRIGYLIDIIKKMKKNKFPKTKIRQFYDLALKYQNSESKFLLTNEIFDKVNKLSDKNKKLVAELFFPGDFFELESKVDLTNIFDILELYSFIKEDDSEVENETKV